MFNLKLCLTLGTAGLLLGLGLADSANAFTLNFNNKVGDTYRYLLNRIGTETFGANATITLSGLTGVTGATVTGGGPLGANTFFTVNSFTPTSAVFRSTRACGSFCSNFPGAAIGFLNVIAPNTQIGTVNVASTLSLTSPTTSGPTPVPLPPVPQTTPEPSSLLGIIGIGMLLGLKKKG